MGTPIVFFQPPNKNCLSISWYIIRGTDGEFDFKVLTGLLELGAWLNLFFNGMLGFFTTFIVGD